jgi:hypothetical protein
MQPQNKTPLSNIQVELLKLYSTDLSETDLNELKEQLAQFYAKKATYSANQQWKEKELTDKDMDNWLNDDKQ